MFHDFMVLVGPFSCYAYLFLVIIFFLVALALLLTENTGCPQPRGFVYLSLYILELLLCVVSISICIVVNECYQIIFFVAKWHSAKKKFQIENIVV